mmetsp:Transcript_20768/g.49104  ORF Transcript_20768/g.49104 Transcript_20768/m.49104 type:complete len:565 (-) Transcript_20768:515-2209(-)
MRMALTIMKLAILWLGSTAIHRCDGRRWGFHSIHDFGNIRGGDASYNGYQHNQYGHSDLPPSLPKYGEDETHSRGHGQPVQEEQYRHDSRYDQQLQYHTEQDESHRQQKPSLPSGAYGIDHGHSPLPHPSHYGQQQYPSLPNDDSIFQVEEELENMNMNTAFGGEGADDNRGGMDLSAFDKEYILKGLAKLYKKKILPLEISSRYGHFHSPPLSPADFVAPPQVLLLGQYSVGKTSFIKYLVGRDFPGIRVGPEPTTDRFTTLLWGPNDKIVPGAALCSQTDLPFTGLSPYGNNFLSRLEGVEADSPILRNVTLIDTPGILSGQKQRSRNYDYESVMKWFGERADLVIVMFDAHKLDISDELKGVMELFIPHLDKIRIVLNKADSISTQQLMRVYGALMWSLGKVMNTPEVCRVFMGSFWDAPLKNTDQMELLQREETDLLNDIMNLPQQAVMRRINELVKRARSVKVHAYIIHYLRKQLPYTWGKREKQRRLIARLESEFAAAARRYGLPKGDFPSIEPFRKSLLEIKDLSEFPKLDKRYVREMDKVFSVDIPDLLEKARDHR